MSRRDPLSLDWPGSGSDARNERESAAQLEHGVACRTGNLQRLPRERRPVHGTGIVLTIAFTLAVFCVFALVLVLAKGRW